MAKNEEMSNPEKEVGEFLSELGLWWKYESPLYLLDESDRPRIWTPDFYLPLLNMYVEVCGDRKFDYDYRERVYEKNVCKMIFVHYYKEPEKWKTFLVQRINDMHERRSAIVQNMVEKAKGLSIQIQ